MFRRSAKEPQTSTPPPVEKQGGKGRPTPSRKEAEAAARERARVGMDKKAARQVLRERQAERNKQMREGMRRGDEKFLPKRDQGPVRRYIRDWIDSRLCIAELLLPALLAIMALIYSGSEQAVTIGNGLWSATILVVLVDTVWLTFRLKRALRAQFPDEELRGTTFYAVTRVIQLRPLRMPKPKVKIGGAPK